MKLNYILKKVDTIVLNKEFKLTNTNDCSFDGEQVKCKIVKASYYILQDMWHTADSNSCYTETYLGFP